MRFPLSFLKAALALGSLGGAQASLKHASSADFEKLADLTRPANLKHHAHGHQHPSHSDESEVGQGIDWMAEPASYAGPMRIVGMGEVPAADDQHGAGKQKQIQKAMNEMEKGAKKTAKNGAQSSNSGGSSFSPTNPPSIPLAVRSPCEYSLRASARSFGGGGGVGWDIHLFVLGGMESSGECLDDGAEWWERRERSNRSGSGLRGKIIFHPHEI